VRPPEPPVLVVGAGLSGLACALHLSESGVPVHLLEASDGVGGRVRTDMVAGFRLDRGREVAPSATAAFPARSLVPTRRRERSWSRPPSWTTRGTSRRWSPACAPSWRSASVRRCPAGSSSARTGFPTPGPTRPLQPWSRWSGRSRSPEACSSAATTGTPRPCTGPFRPADGRQRRCSGRSPEDRPTEVT
jgi:glycine/D-amino acid oxidase-like deaminating enzyme